MNARRVRRLEIRSDGGEGAKLALADALMRGYFDRWGLAVSSMHLRPDGVEHRKLGFEMAAQPLLHRSVPSF
jgi:hypothetical protein